MQTLLLLVNVVVRSQVVKESQSETIISILSTENYNTNTFNSGIYNNIAISSYNRLFPNVDLVYTLIYMLDLVDLV